MNTCKECKHWTRNPGVGGRSVSKVGLCRGLVVIVDGDNDFDVDVCELTPGEVWEDTAERLSDGETIVAKTTTHQNFGCVRWEAKK